ncbi:MAG: radical SAM protein [Candidatus Aminicenantes bacterium]|nr:radical SAM protein [Candidatus Aminicenantes bacterium]
MNLKRYSTRSWIIENPRIFYRVVRGFFRGLLLKKNTLRTVHLLPTFDCQAKCKMCSVAKFKQSRENLLTLSDYGSIADQAARMGAIAVTFLGGEPLLVKNLEEIIRIFKSRHFYLSIVSNGIAVNREYLKKLRSAGLDAIFFGLESLDEKVNDELRGFNGQYQRVMEAVRLSKAEGLFVGFCTVLFPGAEDRYIEMAEYCRQNGLAISLPSLAGVGAAENERAASADEYEQIIDLIKKYPHLSVDWAFSYYLRHRCPSGKEKIAITCYGDVMGCSLNHISFGNIKVEPLKRIWKRMGRFSQFRKNSDRCLASFDSFHIDNFLAPITEFEESPVFYKDHPNITPEKEPGLFTR